MTAPFNSIRAAARALLNDDQARLTRKAGSFLGQLVADPMPLSDAQESWIATLLEKNGFAPLSEEAVNGQ